MKTACFAVVNGTDQEVNGDTLFEIGSSTKTFQDYSVDRIQEDEEVYLAAGCSVAKAQTAF